MTLHGRPGDRTGDRPAGLGTHRGPWSPYFALYLVGLFSPLLRADLRSAAVVGLFASCAYGAVFVAEAMRGPLDEAQVRTASVRLIELLVVMKLAMVSCALIRARGAETRGRAVAEQNAVRNAVLETAHSAVVSMDGNGRITRWNVNAEATFGRPREDVMGRGLHDPHHPRALPRDAPSWSREVPGGR